MVVGRGTPVALAVDSERFEPKIEMMHPGEIQASNDAPLTTAFTTGCARKEPWGVASSVATARAIESHIAEEHLSLMKCISLDFSRRRCRVGPLHRARRGLPTAPRLGAKRSRRDKTRRARLVPVPKEVAEVLLVAPSQEESHQSSVPGMQAPRDPND